MKMEARVVMLLGDTSVTARRDSLELNARQVGMERINKGICHCRVLDLFLVANRDMNFVNCI